MSADNGIYVLGTHRTRLRSNPDGSPVTHRCNVWRIAHAQAIENLDYYADEELDRYLSEVWGKSRVYYKLEKALVAAHKMAEEQPILEYGVAVFNLSDRLFPGDY